MLGNINFMLGFAFAEFLKTYRPNNRKTDLMGHTDVALPTIHLIIKSIFIYIYIYKKVSLITKYQILTYITITITIYIYIEDRA